MGSLVAQFHRGVPLSSSAFIRQLREQPDLAREVDPSTGALPLHLACLNAAPHALIASLLSAFASAAATPAADGHLPLHGALSARCEDDTVDALLRAHPDAARAPLGQHTPLHLAAAHGASVSTVRRLLAAWPAAAAARDAEGNTPLHFAAASQADADVVRALLEACPAAARLRGHMKRLPLSLAFLFEAPPEAVKLLLEANPDALRDGCITADHQNHGKGGSEVGAGTPTGVGGRPQFNGHFSMKVEP
ncbi:hypothetical protein AB1Y20_016264 [Prymnesium parvum]|uniref:Uncharacterized protein n=1 Tax=Prymnesium parvum TaxID=97485 RepID=A0AB34IEU4_PRYPA